MPNYCYYEMKVIGSDDAIDELISMMKYSHPTHHFYRAFEADVYERGENYAFISGDVAWSINCAMFCYIGYCNGTDKQFDFISNVSERLQLEIEIFSSEPGIGFQEHYLIRCGEMIIDDCKDYSEYYFDEYYYKGNTYEDKFADFIEKSGLKISPDDLDENGYYHYGGIENWCVWTI